MAIVEMSKIKLVGMNYHRDEILNALQSTGCVELSFSQNESEELTERSKVDTVLEEEKKQGFVKDQKVYEISDKLHKTVDFFNECIERFKQAEKIDEKVKESQKSFNVSLDEFSSITKKQEKLLAICEDIKNVEDKLAELRSEKIKLNNLCSQITPYLVCDEKFSSFNDTVNTKVYFGTVKSESVKTIAEFFEKEEFADFVDFGGTSTSVILAVVLKGKEDGAVKKLNEAGFSKCPFNEQINAKVKYEKTQKQIENVDKQTDGLYEKSLSKLNCYKDLLILTDYYKFLIEKQEDSEKFSYTSSTFLLEGYAPTEKVEQVKNTVEKVSSAVFMEFSLPTKDDNPPTLTRNGKLVSQTEFITDMYSAPNYREVDPNKTVFFFFMLFMGVIMADIGYGVLMITLGIILSARIKVNNGTKKLWNIIAIGGVFTILFGVLFNSFFGYSVLPFTIMPSPVPSETNPIDNTKLILLLCLFLGVVQIAVGYFMKGVNSFHNHQILDGILDGFVWVLFFIGFVFAVFNFLLDYLMSDAFVLKEEIKNFFDMASTPALYVVLGTLLIEVLTAGRHEKGFGKFTKGFGAVYGLINIMSDILSYARLFGLMLSGMIIASTFNNIGGGVMASGGVTYLLGGLIIAVGHAFNIAMGVLGAYIHDSRLQYIEYFGKFYSGEGEKFTPVGSNFNYIYLTK